MKNLVFSCLLIACSYALRAQVPQSFNYQAIARDVARQPLAGANLQVKISILRGGVAVYTENKDVITAPTGLFTVQVGSDDPVQFAAIDWSDGPLFIRTEVSGDADITVSAVPIVAVPYALLAQDVVNAPAVQSAAPLIGEGTGSAPLRLSPGTTNGQVLKWNGSSWAAAADETGGTGGTVGGDLSGPIANVQLNPGVVGAAELSSMGAVSGQVLRWNGTAWAPANAAGGTSVVETDATLTGDGTVASPLQIGKQGATVGQVLKWNGSSWVPSQDNSASGSAGAVAVGPTLTGDGSAGTPLGLAQQGATLNQVLKWNGTTWSPSEDITINGTASGDVSGPFTNLQLNNSTVGTQEITNGSIAATDLSSMGAASGQVLQWNGSAWAPATLSGSGGQTSVAVNTAGLSISGNPTTGYTISNTGLLTTTPAGGDVGGTFGNLSVNRLQGNSVSSTTPATNQVLKWNGSAWTPAPDDTGSGGGGQTTVAVNTAGLSISGTPAAGYTISNTGLLTTTTAGGDVGGTFGNLSVNRLRGNPVSVTAPATNQVLKWSGSAWTPSTDDTGSSSWASDASGINYSGGTAKVHTSAGGKLVEMGSAATLAPTLSLSSTNGALAVYDQNNKAKSILWHVGGNPTYGAVSIFGPSGLQGYPPVSLYASPTSNGGGEMYLTNNTNTALGIRVGAGITNYDAGYFTLSGPAGKVIAAMGGYADIPNTGYLGLTGASGNPMVSLGGFSNTPNSGYLILANPNNPNLRSVDISVDPNNNGQLVLYNSSNTQSIFLGFDGAGSIAIPGVKNFYLTHPRDTTKEIWYACIEGPEAGMYERGTAALTNGEAWVPFSEHFSAMLADNSLTVTLTPQFADTYGLAIVEKTGTGIRVKELKNGAGNFKFDWEVKGVRKGYENYQAVRPKKPRAAALPNDNRPVKPQTGLQNRAFLPH